MVAVRLCVSKDEEAEQVALSRIMMIKVQGTIASIGR